MAASKTLMTSARTNSFMFGLSLHWCKAMGSWLSSIKILWVQKDRFISLMSAIFQAVAFLCLFKTYNNLSLCSADRFEAMMTRSCVLFPRKAYARCSGNVFNSNSGGSSVDGFIPLFFALSKCLKSFSSSFPIESLYLPWCNFWDNMYKREIK